MLKYIIFIFLLLCIPNTLLAQDNTDDVCGRVVSVNKMNNHIFLTLIELDDIIEDDAVIYHNKYNQQLITLKLGSASVLDYDTHLLYSYPITQLVKCYTFNKNTMEITEISSPN